MNKYQHIFDTAELSRNIKKKSLRSGVVTVSSQGIMFILQLATTMILARILTPQDYGINAMAVSVTGFANMFSNLGLSTATIQRAEINHEQVSTLFWINTAVGGAMTLIVASISPVVAWFYKKPELFWVMMALSVIFLVNGMIVQHSALLNRQMRFYSIAKIQVLSTLFGFVVAIVAACHGYAFWSLVLSSLASVVANALGTWFACGWLPGLPHRNVGVGSMIKFGADLVGFNTINYFARNLDNVLIGRYHGSAALGIYSKAYQLLMMPITNLRDPLTRVAMPALSRLQKEPEQYRKYYLKCISLLSFISMPLVIFMFVCSDQLVDLLLGSQWHGASVIFKILACAALIQPISTTTGMVLLSTGRSRLYLIMGAANAILISLSFVLGLPWGPTGVAVAYVFATYITLLPNLFYTFKGTPISVNNFSFAVCKPLLASIIMGGGCHLLLNNMFNLNAVLLLVFSFLGSVVLYLLSYIVFGGRQDLSDYFSYVLLIFNKH